jgi:hypothetical protein
MYEQMCYTCHSIACRAVDIKQRRTLILYYWGQSSPADLGNRTGKRPVAWFACLLVVSNFGECEEVRCIFEGHDKDGGQSSTACWCSQKVSIAVGALG